MRFIVKKERGVFITIPEAMETLDSCQLDVFEKLFADFEVNQRIHDGLRPFRVTAAFTTVGYGIVPFEDNYMHFTGNAVVIIGSTFYKIKFINDDEWGDATRSQLRQPTATSAIAKDIGKTDASNEFGGFQLFPFDTLSGAYEYLRRPATPVLAVTTVGRVITYDPNASTQLEWQDNYINEIIFAALSYWGINMDSDRLIQYAEMQKMQTDNP